VTRNIRIVLAVVLFASCSSCLRGETAPAFDSTDEHAIELALRALKMTPPDLSFMKTNVESELVLHKAGLFLQQPLALPAYGQSVMSNLQPLLRCQNWWSFHETQSKWRNPHSTSSLKG
jgi:chromosome condensin MukBEF MukE localization factor